MRWVWRICIAAVATALVAIAVSWFTIDWDEQGAEDYPGGVVLRDCNGEILRVALGPNDVDCRPYYRADPEDWIVKALVAVEDGEFWSHCGVRPLSIMRAFFQNVFYRRRISGASTITMQAVRLIRPHAKSYFRKWVEAFEAMKMERKRTKEWIITQYLNRAPFGSNFVGIEAAANGWFGKGAKALGLGEAAMLAAMVQAPSRFRPDRGYEAAFRRRNHVLERMLKLGFIDADQMEGAKSVWPEVNRAPRPFKAPYYCDWFVREHGLHAGDVTTPLDPDIQAVCEGVVNSAAKEGYSVAAVVMRVGGNSPLASQIEQLPYAMANDKWQTANPVVALACSGDYFDRAGGQVNTALAPRPAGSTLKPILAAMAMDMGLATPDGKLNDAPIFYKGYRPANFDSQYRGPVSLRDSLVLSLNIPFVLLLERVGIERFGNALRSMGFDHIVDEDSSYGLGMAIGNAEVTLWELVRAYRIIAQGGGGIVSEGAAYLVSDMLSGAERSTAAIGHVADVRLPRFAWKTGTSSAYRDAWTVMWNPEWVIGVWAGHKRGGFGDKRVVGALAAAPHAWRIARALYPGNDGPWFSKPSGVGTWRVCRETGLPASANCEETEEGQFLSGRSRQDLCPKHSGKWAGGAQQTQKLTIVKPEDGAVFSYVDGMAQQRIVAEVIGSSPDAALWWFLDGVPAGRTIGSARFSFEPTPGEHTISCAGADGGSATASFTVSKEPEGSHGR